LGEGGKYLTILRGSIKLKWLRDSGDTVLAEFAAASVRQEIKSVSKGLFRSAFVAGTVDTDVSRQHGCFPNERMSALVAGAKAPHKRPDLHDRRENPENDGPARALRMKASTQEHCRLSR
jgi:hypothetical protein